MRSINTGLKQRKRIHKNDIVKKITRNVNQTMKRLKNKEQLKEYYQEMNEFSFQNIQQISTVFGIFMGTCILMILVHLITCDFEYLNNRNAAQIAQTYELFKIQNDTNTHTHNKIIQKIKDEYIKSIKQEYETMEHELDVINKKYHEIVHDYDEQISIKDQIIYDSKYNSFR